MIIHYAAHASCCPTPHQTNIPAAVASAPTSAPTAAPWISLSYEAVGMIKGGSNVQARRPSVPADRRDFTIRQKKEASVVGARLHRQEAPRGPGRSLHQESRATPASAAWSLAWSRQRWPRASAMWLAPSSRAGPSEARRDGRLRCAQAARWREGRCEMGSGRQGGTRQLAGALPTCIAVSVKQRAC